MKIVFVTPLFQKAYYTGAAKAIYDMACLLSKKNEVIILTSDAKNGRYWYDPIWGKREDVKKEVVNNIKIIRISTSWIVSDFCFILSRYFSFIIPKRIYRFLYLLGTGPYFNKLEDTLLNIHPDVIHAASLPLGFCWQISRILKKGKLKVKSSIITPFFHSEMDEFKNPLFKKIFDSFDKIHVVTNMEGEIIQKKYGVVGSKIFYASPLFDIAKIKSVKERNKIDFIVRHDLIKKKIILFVASKGKFKGTTNTLIAVNKIYKTDKRIRLLAIGNRMKEWNDQLKLIKDKSFLIDLPFVDEMTKEIAFSICDVYCLPSISESFGYGYFDAWLYKKSVIACKIPALIELIEMNKGGLLVPFNDSNKLMGTIKRLITNATLAARLGNNGYKALIKKYAFKQNYSRYKKLFDEGGN